MLNDEEATRLVGTTLRAVSGEELGVVDTVATHAGDNRAAWAAINAEGHRVLVPLDGASMEGDHLQVRYSRSQIIAAPEHDGEAVTAQDAERLYKHYGIDDSDLRDHHGAPTDIGRGQAG